MSRIDDALRRIAGGAAEPRPLSSLERYAPEKGHRPEEHKISNFAAASPLQAEGRPSVSQKGTASATPQAALPEPSHEAEPNAEVEKLIDLRPVIDYVGFLWGSLRRHKILAFGTFSLALAMTA